MNILLKTYQTAIDSNTVDKDASQGNAIAFVESTQSAKATISQNRAGGNARQMNAITNVADTVKDMFKPEKKENCVIL